MDQWDKKWSKDHTTCQVYDWWFFSGEPTTPLGGFFFFIPYSVLASISCFCTSSSNNITENFSQREREREREKAGGGAGGRSATLCWIDKVGQSVNPSPPNSSVNPHSWSTWSVNRSDLDLSRQCCAAWWASQLIQPLQHYICIIYLLDLLARPVKQIRQLWSISKETVVMAWWKSIANSRIVIYILDLLWRTSKTRSSCSHLSR